MSAKKKNGVPVINILEQPWTLVRRDLSEDNGRMDPALREIQTTSELSPGAFNETFFHELLHAMCEIARPPFLKSNEEEEAFVSQMSPVIYAVLSRNGLLNMGQFAHLARQLYPPRAAKK